jgi:RNA polymerase sigma-70 factor (ECF subfamily)
MHHCADRGCGRSSGAAFDPESLLAMAKSGDAAALGCLLERYRNYMGLLVRLQTGTVVRCKRDIESILEESSREIHRNTARFRGVSEQEFLRWVRRVIAEVLANQVRRDSGAACRDPRLERAFVDELDQSSFVLNKSFGASQGSSGQQKVRENQAVLVADALQELPEDHREVIILRQLEGLRFPDVASRLGRTEDNVKSVWVRALARLRFMLEGLR